MMDRSVIAADINPHAFVADNILTPLRYARILCGHKCTRLMSAAITLLSIC